ncbi:MAG: response regulator, partial [Candidatus Dadabacteria bacterium]
TLGQAAKELVVSGVTTFEEIRAFVAYENMRSGPRQKTETPAIKPRDGGIAKPHILLIEDDRDVLDMLSAILRKEMFDVTEAVNGADGLEKLYQNPPDIVLCDLMMPKMDGKEFLRRIKASKETKDIPVVILTAADTADNEIALFDIGAKDFISKTTDPAVMLSRIRRIIAEQG